MQINVQKSSFSMCLISKYGVFNGVKLVGTTGMHQCHLMLL
jgi:hypothetical protein